jgi:hypothetical protein
MAAVELRTLTLVEIVASAFRLYGDTVLPALPIALVANLPLLWVSQLPMEPESANPAELGAALAVILICMGVAVSAITRVLVCAAVGKTLSVGALARLTFRRRLFSVTLAYAVTNFVANAGLLVFVLPGLFLGGLFAAAVPAVVVEGLASLPAAIRSLGLMRKDLLKAMAAFSFAVLASEMLPVGVLLLLQSATGPSPFTPLLAVTINGITLPLALAVSVVLYISGRAEQGAAAAEVQAELARAAGDA